MVLECNVCRIIGVPGYSATGCWGVSLSGVCPFRLITFRLINGDMCHFVWNKNIFQQLLVSLTVLLSPRGTKGYTRSYFSLMATSLLSWFLYFLLFLTVSLAVSSSSVECILVPLMYHWTSSSGRNEFHCYQRNKLPLGKNLLNTPVYAWRRLIWV